MGITQESLRVTCCVLETCDESAVLRRVGADGYREKLEFVGDEVRELIEQRAQGLVTAFVVVHRTWDLKRTGLYKWHKDGRGWQITEVTVLAEQTTSRFTFGLHPPRPAGASDSAA